MRIPVFVVCAIFRRLPDPSALKIDWSEPNTGRCYNVRYVECRDSFLSPFTRYSRALAGSLPCF
jgi:hypothetical protein